MECYELNCPYYNFDNGPFEHTQEDLEKVSKEFKCDLMMVRVCASTTPDGVVHDEEALDIVYNGSKEENENA